MLAGENNVIADISEYSGRSSPDIAPIADFQSCLHDCGLIDLPCTGCTYTWTGIRSSGRMWKRLDRALVTSSWLFSFGSTSVDVLARATSDHCPLLLHIGSLSPPAGRPFKFQTFWTSFGYCAVQLVSAVCFFWDVQFCAKA